MVCLGDDSDEGEERSSDAELEDANVDDVEVCQSTSRRLDSIEREDPRLWTDIAEVFFLLVQAGRDVVAHEREEACDHICFVAIA